ncbi:MAG: hypothetical protein RMI45_01300, partial [Ignisphaera sp.]|nr:hypothetical protein [Ignisphaera sp.]
ADTVRSLQKKLNLDDSAAHWMAIKSMEVYGAFIASRSSYIDCVDSVEKVFTVWSRGRLPLIMPFNIIRENDLLPHTWYVTSDAISVFIASLLEADMVVLTKLVDGITINGTVAAIVRAHEVPLDQDVIDSYTPVLIRRYGIPTAIVNAGNTKTVSCLLEKIEGCPSYTLIIP